MTGLRERKKAQTRMAIIAEAGHLFTAQGFQSTTMDEIAAAAGVSPATLYNYFGTKNSVLLAHVETTVGEMIGAGSGILTDPPPDVVDAVQALMAVVMDHFIALDRELLREVFAAGFGPAREVLPELIRLDLLVADQLAQLLQAFVHPHGLAPGIDVEEAVIAIYSAMATQLVMYVSMDELTVDAAKQAVARQIEIMFTGLGAHER
jgi:AcrR family transcriptional regulator